MMLKKHGLKFAGLVIGFAFLTIITQVAQASTNLFSDSFGTVYSNISADWKKSGPGEVVGIAGPARTENTTLTGVESDKYTRVDKTDSQDGWICRKINAAGYEALSVSYYLRGDRDAEVGDKGLVQYRADGSCESSDGWTNITTFNLASIAHIWSGKIKVDLPDARNKTFYIRFFNDAKKDNSTDNVNLESFRVDEVNVEGTLVPPTPPTPPAPVLPTTSDLHADKIICDNESDLPNWGAGGPDITKTTAKEFMAQHPNCHTAPDWTFEWAGKEVSNPGDNIQTGGEAWHPFVENAVVPANALVLIREQMPAGYIPFTGRNNTQNVSAEIYCNTNVLNYDNYEFIDKTVGGQRYYCVAWNVVKREIVVEPPQEVVPLQELTAPTTETTDAPIVTPDVIPLATPNVTVDPVPEVSVDPIIEAPQIIAENVVVSDPVVDPVVADPVIVPEVVLEAVPEVVPEVVADVVSSSSFVSAAVVTAPEDTHEQIATDPEKNSCDSSIKLYQEYLTKKNKGSVIKLQAFLNEYIHTHLVNDGIFGKKTLSAVRSFQLKFKDQILECNQAQ